MHRSGITLTKSNSPAVPQARLEADSNLVRQISLGHPVPLTPLGCSKSEELDFLLIPNRCALL